MKKFNLERGKVTEILERMLSRNLGSRRLTLVNRGDAISFQNP